MPKKLIIAMIVLVPTVIIGTILLVGALGESPSQVPTPAQVAAAGSQPEFVGTPAPALDGSAIDEGKQVYGQHCASCHGVNAEGQFNWKSANADGTLPAPPHDDSGHTWHHADSQLTDIITLGPEFYAQFPDSPKSNMPGFIEILTPAEIESVLTYIKSLWNDENRQSQWDVSNGGEHSH